jgi:GT2 family glycosyltransferase
MMASMTESRPATVAGVVLTHNRIDDLKRCLSALHAQTRQLDFLIVVDNASRDATPTFLAHQRDITVVTLATNSGSAGGFRAGMEAAAKTPAEWWWIMDDDCLPAASALERLVKRCVNAPPTLGGVAPMVRYSDGAVTCGLTWPRSAIGRGHHDARRVDWAPFCGLLLRAEACLAIGPVRDDFFMWNDDAEYCLRLYLDGWWLAAAPEAVFYHPALSGGPVWRDYYAVRNGFIVDRMLNKAMPGYGTSLGRTLARACKHLACMMTQPRSNRTRMLMLVKGLVDALFGRTGPRVLPPLQRDSRGR